MVTNKKPSTLLVVLAFASVYIIWGSTYFFIEMLVRFLPPMVIGSLRYMAAGIIMLIIVVFKGERIWNRSIVFHAAVSGLLLLALGNGGVIWAEQYLHSSFVAIFLSSAPFWFLLLDKINWKQNFSNRFTLLGVFVGLIGVGALFYEKIKESLHVNDILPILVLCIANIGWVSGSLYSKYKIRNASPVVVSAWQMLAAGLAFSILAILNNEFKIASWELVPVKAWMAMGFLIIFGSIIAFSAYVFLLDVKSPAQVSTYAYVNPLVAVLLGMYINHDKLTLLQLTGLVIILCSVFFINLAKREQVRKINGGEA